MISNRERILVGNDCRLSDLSCIGDPAQDSRSFAEPRGLIRIGNRVEVRAFATVNLPLLGEETTVGDDCRLFYYSHVAHDCVLGPKVTLANSVQLAGHVHVHEGATLGLGAVVRQRHTIGAYAMIGQGSNVVDDVPPFEMWAGNPARRIGWNARGMERAGFSKAEIERASLGLVSGSPLIERAWDTFVLERGRYERAVR